MKKIKKGDTVFILSGKDKGKKGKVLTVLHKKNKILVEGINVFKKHQRQTQQFQGGIIERILPIQTSKVKLFCSRCNKPTRVGVKAVGEKKARYCKKCNEVIDKV
jgi:large subunit ribosomal protein L24